MKKWAEAEIKALEVSETAFGLVSPENADSEKTVIVINGKQGYLQEFGEKSK